MQLEPKAPGAIDYDLPSDDEIRTAFRLSRLTFDPCQHAYLYDKRFGERAEHIIVTAGSLDRSYEILGSVDFGKEGVNCFQSFAISTGGVAFGNTQHLFAQATPAEINALLRRRALRLYGDQVDAVINVAYQTNPRNDVNATGLAVHFIGKVAGDPQDAQRRLEELKKLLDAGLISESEYQTKRKEILEGLSTTGRVGGAARISAEQPARAALRG